MRSSLLQRSDVRQVHAATSYYTIWYRQVSVQPSTQCVVHHAFMLACRARQSTRLTRPRFLSGRREGLAILEIIVVLLQKVSRLTNWNCKLLQGHYSLCDYYEVVWVLNNLAPLACSSSYVSRCTKGVPEKKKRVTTDFWSNNSLIKYRINTRIMWHLYATAQGCIWRGGGQWGLTPRKR